MELILLYFVLSLVLLQCYTIIILTKQEDLFRVTPVLNAACDLITSPALKRYIAYVHEAGNQQMKVSDEH